MHAPKIYCRTTTIISSHLNFDSILLNQFEYLWELEWKSKLRGHIVGSLKPIPMLVLYSGYCVFWFRVGNNIHKTRFPCLPNGKMVMLLVGCLFRRLKELSLCSSLRDARQFLFILDAPSLSRIGSMQSDMIFFIVLMLFPYLSKWFLATHGILIHTA